MNEREILLADSDSEVRRQMADSFREAGYSVETTDSTTHVFCTVLEKQMPVILLGSGFDKKMALAELVRLLKQCNRGVTIILVSDEENLSTIRTIRQEGIFYQALKPSSREDAEEILSAVECAFIKSDRILMNDHAANPVLSDSRAMQNAAISTTAPVTGESPAEISSSPAPLPSPIIQHAEETRTMSKPAFLAAAGIALAGIIALAFTGIAFGRQNGESNIAMWGFFAFCALLVVSQTLPAFFSFMAAKKAATRILQEKIAGNDVKQHAHAVFDREK
jgi:CheY-like chemotaxis protein